MHSQSLAILAMSAGYVTAKVAMAGVNIAGCDFIASGDNSGGVTSFPAQQCPTEIGPTQMTHFHDKDGFNVFRIPATWQSFVNNDLDTNALDETFMQEYDTILESCLSLGAHCIVDIHNYAHWEGKIINQGGRSSGDLAKTWSQLATRYAANESVIFGIMNEPHGDQDDSVDFDMTNWAGVVQDSVTAIRNAGATSQYIFMSGTAYDNADAFVGRSAPALSAVTNPDGTTNNLIYEVHQYFDGGGKTTDCYEDHTGTFTSLGDYLRDNGRKAFIGEIGGGNTQTCIDQICPSLDVINSYDDVYLGWTSWAAGSWSDDYELLENPNGDQDQLIVSSCFAAKFQG